MQAPAMVLLIGLAVGVDYSMFYLKREREERAAGRSDAAALEAAAATSGRSVLVSGLTVISAMAGMFLTGDPTFASLGVATILVVAVAVLGSLTVLPALLSKLGDKVDRLRVPWSAAYAATAAKAGSGARSSTASCADRSCPPCSPAGCCWRSPHRRSSSAWPCRARTRSRSRSPSMQTYERMQQAFPGTALPANVVVKAPNVNAPAVRRAIDRLEQRAIASGQMYEPITVDVNSDATVANITIPIAGKAQTATRTPPSPLLRERSCPETVGAAAERGDRRHRAGRPVEGLAPTS